MTLQIAASDHGGAPHRPVMLAEMLEALAPRDGAVYVDGTFGAGGYSRALLMAAACTVYGIDRDPTVASRAQDMERLFGGRFIFLQGRFSDLVQILRRRGVGQVDGIVLDLGISSMQVDEAERGFSFRQDGPLDMRMEQTGESAADVVNNAAEETLADILHRFGEERASRRIAKAIVKARAKGRIERTSQLADIVRATLGHGKRKDARRLDPATRTFQALRIYINDELGELQHALSAAEQVLAPGGRLAVVTFHSLEDRIVKQFFTARAGKEKSISRHQPAPNEAAAEATFRLPRQQLRKVSEAEAEQNPRARSAKLRLAIRTEAPPTQDKGARP